jgi:hypothetical protein
MSNEDALQQARAQLKELLAAAKTGAIIPVRLPDQIKTIDDLLAEAEEAQTASQQSADVPADIDEVMKENATFTSVAVHELRTPMTSIRGYSDMLINPAMGELTDMQQQFLDTIRTNAKRMEKLLADVSYTNKIRANTLQIGSKMDMFKNIALRAEKDSRPIAEELYRQLEFDIPDGLPLLNTDGELLALALVKLIENGLRYSPEESGKVTVRGAAEDNTLVITVEDNGIGMTPEEIVQLGTLYFRSDSDVVREYKGSGLGIPIAYGLVKLLDGTITVESQPDQGTTFTIKIAGMS